MERCWSGEPSKRPLLGAIQPVLELIQQKAERGKSLEQVDALNLQETSSSKQINPVLALTEPNNQRGAAHSPLPSKRKTHNATKPIVSFHARKLYQIPIFSNMYIPMREF